MQQIQTLASTGLTSWPQATKSSGLFDEDHQQTLAEDDWRMGFDSVASFALKFQRAPTGTFGTPYERNMRRSGYTVFVVSTDLKSLQNRESSLNRLRCDESVSLLMAKKHTWVMDCVHGQLNIECCFRVLDVIDRSA